MDVSGRMVEDAVRAMIACGEKMDSWHMEAAFQVGDRYVARAMLEAALDEGGRKGA